MKIAPRDPVAVNPNPAIHHGGQLAGDGQAETRSPVFSRHRAIRLGEGFKYGLLLVGGDANAGVTDAKVKANLVLSARLLLDGHDNFTGFSELDSIAHEIHEYLL